LSTYFLKYYFPFWFFFFIPQYLVLLKELPVEEQLLPEDDIVMLLRPLS